ncbi:hypothetical protein V6N11_061128 [Hibiscus sabdariffa]|uniref:Uncharacterized protein n=1 Tax=Hibiscus sabdariffa TaxID=183260 RepID=A0ABR2PIW0_9ROSI
MRDMPAGVGGILVSIWVIDIVGDTEMKVRENVTKKLRLDYFCHCSEGVSLVGYALAGLCEVRNVTI